LPLRRLLGLLLLCAAIGLMGATPPPLITPTPVPTRAPGAAGQPVVVVYPFNVPSDVNPQTGAAIAQIYAQVLSQSGGLTVLAIPDQIKREDYGKYAHAKGADYYISGYLQPIGDSAAIVAQIYDVTGEISVYSTTTQVTSVQDIASQGLTARTVILRAAGLDQPELAVGAANTPTPSATNGASTSLNNVLGGIFHGKSKGSPKPGASHSPTPPPKPARATIVAHVSGTVPANVLATSTNELYTALNKTFTTSLTAAAFTDPAHQADGICGTNRNNVIASGVLGAQHIGGLHAHEHYTFTLNVYTCFGGVLATYTNDDNDYKKAIDAAVESYVTDHPDNN
jgi:hypothetical protein